MRTLAALVVSCSFVACIYSSEAPTPNASGLSESSDDTDPGDASTITAIDSSTPGDSGSEIKSDAGTIHDAGAATDAASSTAPTFATIYANYFAASSVGECARSGCHSSSRGGFACGSSASSCYTGLVNAGLVNTTTPSSSRLASTSQSPLEWFGGDMPSSGGKNAQAVTDISAWVNAGAQDN